MNSTIEHCYCGHKLEAWRSDFSQHFHYKTAMCKECGRKNRVDVSFIGTGHDTWIAARKKTGFDALVQKEHEKVQSASSHTAQSEEGHGH